MKGTSDTAHQWHLCRPKCRLCHPNTFLFLFLTKIYIGSKNPEPKLIRFWTKHHCCAQATNKRAHLKRACEMDVIADAPSVWYSRSRSPSGVKMYSMPERSPNSRYLGATRPTRRFMFVDRNAAVGRATSLTAARKGKWLFQESRRRAYVRAWRLLEGVSPLPGCSAALPF